MRILTICEQIERSCILLIIKTLYTLITHNNEELDINKMDENNIYYETMTKWIKSSDTITLKQMKNDLIPLKEMTLPNYGLQE